MVRLVHHEVSGPDFAHQTLIDGHEISMGARDVVVQGAPLSRAVRVSPAPVVWSFRSGFSHVEHRLETVFESERYACGTQRTGYGATARSTTRYCTRQVPRQRLVPRRVTDGQCRAILAQTPRIDRRYMIQFDYYAHDRCRARCFEQTPQADGRFSLSPCSAGPVPATGPRRVALPPVVPRAPVPRRAEPRRGRPSEQGRGPARQLTAP